MALQLTDEWDKVFPKSDKVNHKKVSFKNHFGIEIAADLYEPKEKNGKLPAIAISGPYGAVKEQSSGLYAQTLAERGFLTLAFDPSFTGESGGETRYMTSPDLNVEDYQAAVDYLSNLDEADAEKLAIIGICGWGGMALQAACLETRIKAVIASTMYDMTRVAGNGYFDADNNKDARKNARTAMNNQRTEDYKNGEYKLAGGVIDPVPDDAPEFLQDYHAYYKTPRGYHKRSLNSNGGWAIQTNGSLANTRILTYANEIDMPVLIIHGEKAHSRYNSETAFDMITGETKTNGVTPEPYTGVYPVGNTKVGNKELYIVEGASHVDLYDNLDKIPFNKIESFLKESFEVKMNKKLAISIPILIAIIVSVVVITTMMNNKESDKDLNLSPETNQSIDNEEMTMDKVYININNKKLGIDLENNSTTSALIKLLPLELSMNDLNGNEKYVYLNESLPTNTYSPKHIEAGDVMLFGDNCLVIFYESFGTSYSYSKIGHINDLPSLDDGNISISIDVE